MYRTIFLAFVILACISCSSDTSSQPSTVVDPLIELDQLITDDPSNLVLRANRGNWYYEKGEYAKAIIDLEVATSKEDSPIEWSHLLADAYLDHNQSLLALETLQKAIDRNPRSIPTLLKLSEFQLITRQHQDGLNSIAKVHALEPDLAEGSFMKGLIYKDMGDTISAKNAFHEATREDPSLIDGWIELGSIYATENPTEALRYYDAALRQDSTNLAAIHAKAVALADAGRYQDALHAYQSAIRQDRYYADGYFNMGLLYLELDSLQLALDHFDLATKTEPQYVNAYFYRGVVQELTGNLTSARMDYETVIRLDPDHVRAQEGIQRVTPPLQ